jgi:hypothetical protein
MKLIFAAMAALLATGSVRGQDGPPPLAPLPKVTGEGGGTSPVISTMAPPEVVASASAAVAALGDEVVLGRYKAAIDRMFPLWKKRTAARVGGMEKLEGQLDGVARQMVQQGISMISFRPEGQPRSYEVGSGSKMEVTKDSVSYNQWLVLIPTVTKFRITRQNEKTVVIESIGFQVAVSDKGKNDWTFIDGSGLSVNDLRNLFYNLPADMELPPTGKREAR